MRLEGRPSCAAPNVDAFKVPHFDTTKAVAAMSCRSGTDPNIMRAASSIYRDLECSGTKIPQFTGRSRQIWGWNRVGFARQSITRGLGQGRLPLTGVAAFERSQQPLSLPHLDTPMLQRDS